MKHKRINVNGETLSYLHSGEGDNTLLFIHGAFVNKEYWSEQLSYFSNGYRVIAIDLPGHGESSHNRSDWTIKNYGKDVSEFMQKLALKNVIVVGHSLGADVMLETVALHPANIKGLVDVDHLKNVGVELSAETIEYFVKSLENDFVKTTQEYAKNTLVTKDTDDNIINKLFADYSEMSPDVGISLLRDSFSYTKRQAENLKKLRLKLYLLHVVYTDTNEKELRKYLADNYVLYTMRGTSHYPMIESPDNFNSSLAQILLKIKQDR